MWHGVRLIVARSTRRPRNRARQLAGSTTNGAPPAGWCGRHARSLDVVSKPRAVPLRVEIHLHRFDAVTHQLGSVGRRGGWEVVRVDHKSRVPSTSRIHGGLTLAGSLVVAATTGRVALGPAEEGLIPASREIEAGRCGRLHPERRPSGESGARDLGSAYSPREARRARARASDPGPGSTRVRFHRQGLGRYRSTSQNPRPMPAGGSAPPCAGAAPYFQACQPEGTSNEIARRSR